MGNFQGEVVDVVPGKGIYVEMSISGEPARYGPMMYVSSDGIAVNYKSGDHVLITNIGRIPDNFIILGKVMDLGQAPYDQPQAPNFEGEPEQ